jgi:hypothetical protein
MHGTKTTMMTSTGLPSAKDSLGQTNSFNGSISVFNAPQINNCTSDRFVTMQDMQAGKTT